MGFLSFFTSLGLLMFLTYKLISWHNGPPTPKKEDPIIKVESPRRTDAPFIIPSNWTVAPEAAAEKAAKENWWRRAINEPPNQFLVLIFNLLLADIQQALAFLLNIEWLTRNAIEVGTGTCWTQGWFVSTGDLASSVFITGIAIHTYMSIVSVKKIPTWVFHTAIVMMWAFVYGTGILGVVVTENGKKEGGLYVRAGAWCWINSKYQDIRLNLHYLWIFISLIVTTMIYLAIFLHLQTLARKSGAAGRLASMAGHEVSLAYFCFSGAMIACNGWMDVVLYSSTRRSIVFSSEGPPTQDVGLETFTFMCSTPPKFGNTTIVVGGAGPNGKKKSCSKWCDKLARKGPKSSRIKGLKVECSESTDSMRGLGTGESSVLGMSIQYETTTTVSVEVNTLAPPKRLKLAAGSRKMSDASSFSVDSTQSSGSGFIKE
ncbi:integral membrane protein [Colletotrichum incanum]|uniref:Integral membrane protein n=1 Tax=Colletotrichum incanum TaxID=1573173 RepID=A0A166XJ35_COLIC|nr:integral membrane protein [Colletotrichum incanum]